MKLLILLLAVASVAHSKVAPVLENNTAYGYLKNSIKEAERLQALEEQYLSQQRIIGGVPAALGQYPYQAGFLIDIVGITDGRRGVCGGSLISSNRVVGAAHCWSDGQMQGWRVEVVLGSVTLFTGGSRQFSSVFVSHPNWFPLLARNDIGVLYLANAVTTSSTIAPVALPSGSDLEDDFEGSTAIASGFGLTQQDGNIPADQFLSHVSLRVMSNLLCRFYFPLHLHETNICTSGAGTVGACQGDSGGPLVVNRNNKKLLIGVVSFGSPLGCEASAPSVYARTTSFVEFLNQHI